MNIFESISSVMNDLGAIGKTSKNQQQGFMYRGVDAVMNALNPALVKNKVFVVPEILEQTREERTSAKGGTLIYSICKVKYTFYAEDGTSVSAVVIGEGMDSGDKATNKAMSIAFKYACFQVFCIPTEEMVDPDAECHEVKPKKPAAEKPAEDAAIDNASKVAAAAKIDDTKVAALVSKLTEAGVAVEKVLKLYKVETLADLTVAKWKNALDHIEDLKKV